MKPETKYKGSIKLAAIGDALGWITEFEKSQDSIQKKYNASRIDRFFDWQKTVGGRFLGYTDFIKAGSYSDDTQLMLSVARSIKENGDVDQHYFSKVELPNWLHYARGGGRTVKNAAIKISRKSAKWNKNFFTFKVKDSVIDYRDSGANGAAMRILPIALANLGNEEKIKEEIFANSIITHGHPRAIIGAILYGFAINHIIQFRPEDFNPNSFIAYLGKDIHQKFHLAFLNKKSFLDWKLEWNSFGKNFEHEFTATLNETQQYLRDLYVAIQKNISVKDTLVQLGCYENSTKGSGISTVLAGIYLTCIFHNNPTEAINEAVNSIGSDTDSIAAFTGGLIGALHGQNCIPKKWSKVQDELYLEEISAGLLAISEGQKGILKKPANLEGKKSLNSIIEDNFIENELITFDPLGSGSIKYLNRQKTLTSGKYNLILGVEFEIGQYCVFSKSFDLKNYGDLEKAKSENNESILFEIAESKLSLTNFNQLKSYFKDNKNIKPDLIDLLIDIVKG
ncbi:ADP-ribosylglycohydrolase family protein [Adhaeribacter soli]|uniref:ADP-ribosylglycohydrolase family protein n=1 Tax=Adhaeribacter soli TaxID=2607655 RepID=A0A5N1IRQ5_9BACT|nr:ADP-ribosylglycohydrolase family protein [Adhaeribacter soli]KAA9332690.1 ADP-ribosylglycohydrolase family protein [Adhaeribacter soli]